VTSLLPPPRYLAKRFSFRNSSEIRSRSFRAFSLIAGVFCLAYAFGQPSHSAVQSARPVVEVAVLIDERSFIAELSDVESVVEAAKTDTPAGFAVRSRFANPDKTRLLIDERIGRMSREARLQLAAESERPLIDSYLVLEFPNEVAASNAVRRISQQSGIRYVGIMERAEFSQSAPSDPLYSGVLGSTPFSFQWGMSAISAPSAWGTIDGTAYVGIADNGIQASHEDFADANFGSAYKPQFARNIISPTSTVDEREDNAPYAGHGTHVAGIVAARHNSAGGVGVCRACSLMIARVANQAQGLGTNLSNVIAGVTYLARSGSQVINLSLGSQSATSSANRCTTTPSDPFCMALDIAAYYRTAIVGASGNDITRPIQFPASDPRSFSAGGMQRNSNGSLSMWDQRSGITYSNGFLSPPRTANSPIDDMQGETGSNAAEPHSFIAPARDVLASMYQGYNWNSGVRCGTSAIFPTIPASPALGYFSTPAAGAQGFTGATTSPYSGKYGVCTGTSMAAPHLTGAVAMVRSANPLLNVASVKSILNSSANTSTISGQKIPNVSAAVQSALAGNSRLTPLFILTSGSTGNYFQTTVPQMAASAIFGALQPRASVGATSYFSDISTGTLVASFSYGGEPVALPKPPAVAPDTRAIANMRIFTTPRDAAGVSLVPLFRMSYADTSVNGTLTRHYLAAGNAERNALSTSIWKPDGVEGYIYPTNIAQPSGTIRIVRGHDAANLRWTVYPESQIATWQARGYTSGTTFIGYAYPN
jgi:serine protease